MPLRHRRFQRKSALEQLEARQMLTTTPIWSDPIIIQSGINEVIYTEGADFTRNGLNDVVAAGPNVLFYSNTRDSGLAAAVELTNDGVGYGMTLARDIDGDSDLDVVASSSAKGIIVIRNNGDGTFAPEELVTGFGGIIRIATADMDGDGDEDIVSGSYSGKRLAWHANNGDGTFAPDSILNTDIDGLFSVAVADLDGDDRPEIVTAEFGEDNAVAIYRNTLTGFERDTISNDLNAPLAVEIADLDGDGDEDVIAGAYYGDSIIWYENDGSAEFTQNANTLVTDAVGGPFRIRAADWDNDQDLDLISVSSRDDKVAFHENLGQGSFAPQTVLFDNWSSPTAGSPADLDGDGDQDLLVASYADDTLLWVRNDTVRNDERFSDINVISDEVSSVFVVDAVDLDGDGSRDMLAAATGSNQVVWAPNDGEGGFGQVQVIGTQAGSPLFAGAADLDGDGDNDVFSTSSFAADEIIWYENLGGGVFGSEMIIEANLGQPRWLEAGDADGDGDLDLFAATNDDDRYVWYENRLDEPTADFVIGQVIRDGEGAGANKLIPIDMDNDGDLDVLAASSRPSEPKPITWYENDGTGNFSNPIVVADTVSSWYARPADMDGDGDLDVVSSSFVGPLVWFENLGGSFAPASVISTAPQASYGLDVADLDGDGDTDVVTGSYYDNEIAWYENNGDGTFSGQQVISRVQSGPFSVIAADIDGDGDEDVVAGSYYDDTVAWYENDPAVVDDPLLPTIDKYVTSEHLDISFNFQSGEWVPTVDVDELDGTTEFYNPDEAVIYAGPTAQTTRPDGSEWDFIGVPAGDPLWVLPQQRADGIPFPGFAVDRTDSGTFARYFETDPRILRELDWVKFELVNVRGPENGQFGVYTTVGLSDPEIVSWMSTADGISPQDAFWQREGGHSHASFYFSQPGVYEVDLKASGFIDVNGNRIFDPGIDVFSESDASTFYFAVETPNSAPVIMTPEEIEVGFNEVVPLRGANQVVVTDEEPSSGDYYVTLQSTGGVISLTPDGVSLVEGDGANDLSITFEGPLSAVNATLETLEYRGWAGAVDNRIDIEVNDGGFFAPDLDMDGMLDNAASAMGTVEFNVTGDPSGCGTVDLLVNNIANEIYDASLDLDGNGVLDTADLDLWLNNAGPYLHGDATLDGSVDVRDFNAWNENKFTSDVGWCGGDFNADGSADIRDFNIWNENKFTDASRMVFTLTSPGAESTSEVQVNHGKEFAGFAGSAMLSETMGSASAIPFAEISSANRTVLTGESRLRFLLNAQAGNDTEERSDRPSQANQIGLFDSIDKVFADL